MADTLDALRQTVRAERLRRDKAGSADFASAVQDMSASQHKADALKDVGNLALLALGGGAAARGGIGLLQLLNRARRRKEPTNQGTLPLPYPVQPKLAGFLAGDSASSKSGIPWYGPAMLGVGLAGLYGGWKGVDKLLDSRRRAEKTKELETAQEDFHRAMIESYAQPVPTHPKLLKMKAASADDPMEKAAQAIDAAFAHFAAALDAAKSPAPPPALGIKLAVDWSDLAGKATGGYGMYAGLSALLAGALVHDRLKSRSQSAVLDKATQRRNRRQFMQRPTELYAVPEPALAPASSADVEEEVQPRIAA